MAETALPPQTIDPSSGFCPETRTFHSLRPPVVLPPPSLSLSVTDYVLSLLRSCSADLPPPASTAAFIDASSGLSLSYSDLLRRTQNLVAALRCSFPSLSPGRVAFIFSPSSLHLPVLYLALLSLGVVISPANPLSSAAEISHLLRLSKPSVTFSTRAAASMLPSCPLGTIYMDSPEFLSMMHDGETASDGGAPVVVQQSDAAAILYSSGTTGEAKGVLLTHGNFIAVVGAFFHKRPKDRREHPVMLFTLPLFHIFGVSMLLRAVALGITSVIMEKFDFQAVLAAIERFKVTATLLYPPLVVALTEPDIVRKYDLSSLRYVACGGSPLLEEVARKFKVRFPDVGLSQGYGLTETGGGITGFRGPDESKHYGSAGRLAVNTEAKIVDPLTGEALPPGQQGELWLRGPTTMKGYVGDDEATAAIIDPEGWLKTGDLCYFDSGGFLFVVDRLKELIKYKAYQVAPAELEHLLQSNPEIADAAVVPYPDEEAGQIPMAFVVRKPSSSITAAGVMDFMAKQVPPYKKIRRVAFINAIPKSPGGKLLRRELVKALSATSS